MRQAEPGAAVHARGRAVGLRERLEDRALLVRRNADAGVDDAEVQRRARAGADSHVVRHADENLALVGELERVATRLTSTCRSRRDRRRRRRARPGSTSTVSSQLLLVARGWPAA